MTTRRQTNQNCDESTRYHAAKAILRHKVLSGELGHGGQLQPELEICRDVNLSRTTVRKAIADLVAEGLLVRYRGRGTFVNYRRSPAQKRLLAFLMGRHGPAMGAFDLVLKGAQEVVAERGYQLMLAHSQDGTSSALDQAMHLNDLRVAGTILAPLITSSPDSITPAVLRALQGGDQKVVMVDTPETEASIPTVCARNREAMHELTCHLIQRGYRRIAFLTTTRAGAVAEREEGFRSAMQENGLDLPPEYFLHVARRNPQYQGIQEVDVFMAMRTRPEAIVCMHDLIALNVLKRCAERGWQVPTEVAVVGFDNLPQAQSCTPPLTTVHQPLFEMGRLAAEMLIRQLEGEALVAMHESLPCHLIVRGSCGTKLP